MTHLPRSFALPTVLALLGLVLTSCADDAGVVADIDFEGEGDQAARGWTVVGDGDLVAGEAGQVRDGALVGEDDAVGGVWYFAAPADVAGALTSEAIVGFSLRLEDDPVDPFTAPDVVVGSEGTVLHAQYPTAPTSEWTPYKLDLDQLDWRVGSIEGDELATSSDDPDASPETVAEILNAADLLWLRGEHNTGEDTGYLDDVRITIGESTASGVSGG